MCKMSRKQVKPVSRLFPGEGHKVKRAPQVLREFKISKLASHPFTWPSVPIDHCPRSQPRRCFKSCSGSSGRRRYRNGLSGTVRGCAPGSGTSLYGNEN